MVSERDYRVYLYFKDVNVTVCCK